MTKITPYPYTPWTDNQDISAVTPNPVDASQGRETDGKPSVDLSPEAVEAHILRVDPHKMAQPRSLNADTCALLRALSARLAELEGERDSAVRGRNDWRDDYKALSSAIVGDTGLSAMTVATQARLYRPRAEAAEARLQAAEQLEADLRAAVTTYHLALDRRENGDSAGYRLQDEIQRILDMPWKQGAALSAWRAAQ